MWSHTESTKSKKNKTDPRNKKQVDDDFKTWFYYVVLLFPVFLFLNLASHAIVESVT